MNRIRAVIVDDEKKAILNLSKKIEMYFPDKIRVVETFDDPWEALKEIPEIEPEILFLDISMPGMDGFELLEELSMPSLPVIFTTAYDEHAIKAINNQAVGYILKPLDSDTLKNVLNKSIININEQKNIEQKVGLIDNLMPVKKSITISGVDSLEIINIDEIQYLCGENGYTKIILQDNIEILSSKNLGFYKELLDHQHFYSIHRSYIINLTQIRKYLKEGLVEMKNGQQLPVARSQRKEFLDFLEHL